MLNYKSKIIEKFLINSQKNYISDDVVVLKTTKASYKHLISKFFFLYTKEYGGHWRKREALSSFNYFELTSKDNVKEDRNKGFKTLDFKNFKPLLFKII